MASAFLNSINWHDIVGYSITIIVVYYLIPFLKQHAQAAASTAAKNNIDARAALLAHAEEFIYTVASTIAEKRIPALAAKIKSGSVPLDKRFIKGELYAWGNDLRAEVVSHFRNQGIDLTKELGAQAIDRLIQSAANTVNPFPGQETSAVLVQPGVAAVIVDKGIHAAVALAQAQAKPQN